jgi:indole-3-glycerol phosphate synthase
MAVAVPDILARIVGHKRSQLARASAQRADLESRAADRPAARNFRAALIAAPPAIISEIKQASPSQGVFIDDVRPASIAKLYEALSILTDEEFFKGKLADLEAARSAVAVPVLRKDFTIDEFHIVEAAAHGADAILLIAAILDRAQLRRFRELAGKYGMAALVEVHDDYELDAALDSGADIVGVNNRNLHTFEVTLDTSLRLAEKMPSNVVKIAESGIHSGEDVRRLQAAGFHAFLVGEHLMKSADPAAALRELRS